MKSWLTQGSSGRRVTLPPETTFLQYQWGFIACLAAVFWNVTQRWGKRCVTFQKTAARETTGLQCFFSSPQWLFMLPFTQVGVVNVSPLLSYALSNNPRIVYYTQPEDTHVNNIISLIMHCTVYLLPVFSFAKILQLIVEISASYRFLRQLCTGR